MTLSLRRWALLGLFLGVLSQSTTDATERWVDPKLSVTNGIALWYDLSRQTAARGEAELSPLRSWNDAVDILLDGSGHRRHARQPLATSRPGFSINWGTAALEFDGKDDFMVADSGPGRLTNATVFVVAALREFGGYRSFLAWNARGRNDYTSGLNLDVGSVPATNLVRVNAEGAGFQGETDLLGRPLSARTWNVFALSVGSNPAEVRLAVNGEPRGVRQRTSLVTMQGDDFTLGARRYSNTPERPHVQGFFAGSMTEVLVFDRPLEPAEMTAVTRYLDEKYSSILRGTGGPQVADGIYSLVAVSNPPPVQVHFPGFEARELPVDLSNINNLRCRPDGRLVAVGYDGRIWLLSDANGDGLEEKVAAFWDQPTFRSPIGAALTPAGYARGQGVFVAAKEKLVLVVDRDGDNRGDEEVTVATWTERSEQQGVDALGVAVGGDGSIYFSLGTASFTEPFLVDKATGRARYHTGMERGTVLRVSPDFTRHEIVCSGVRFAVGMAFNREGDLFVTDQEGATWRHDGNPFDELLHIQPGRHYGFPPRHPKHLPDVIDEPSVFDYTPQHQSTCGLLFNESAAAGPAFGPKEWEGEAIVAGYSRGKLWRTKLVKSTFGYVAQTRLLATLQALTVDACVSPRGDLIVATHSGQPDWGSGPTGKGRLWSLRLKDADAAQPVLAWNASPTEIKVAFDQPLKAAALKDVQRRVRVEGGPYVFPGDRFETIRPGYQVVYDQLAAERRRYEVLGVGLSPDLRTLSVQTRPRHPAVNYALTLPESMMATGGSGEVDLLVDQTGVEARWESADGRESWAGWLPHGDLEVAKAFTRGSSEHERLFQLLERPGQLTINARLDLYQMLQPAIQPGASIDWERPPENVIVQFASSRPVPGKPGPDQPSETVVKAPGREWRPFEFRLKTGQGAGCFLSWHTDQDKRSRAFPLRRFLVPWARPTADSGEPPARPDPALAGGNWLHGRKLFFGDQSACARCHMIRGEGKAIGPDLSNLQHRDVASVWKDIESPGAAINPDHISSLIELREGDPVQGLIRGERDGILEVAVVSGDIRRLSGVRSITPSTVSLMPEGLVAHLSGSDRRDLLTFLMTDPVPVITFDENLQGHARPQPRKRSEVEKAMGTSGIGGRSGESPAGHAANRVLRLVLCASAKDPGHGAPGFHDYPLWRDRWSKLMGLADGVAVESADRWPSAAQWAQADLIAFYHDNPAWDASRTNDVDTFLARGGGLVFLHWSLNAYRDTGPLAERLGCAWGAGAKFRHGPEELTFHPHEVTRGFPANARFVDETYWNLPGTLDRLTVAASAVEEGAARPQAWTMTRGKGRVFVCIPGHFSWTFDDPLYRLLVFRGMAWAAGTDLDRWDELLFIGTGAVME